MKIIELFGLLGTIITTWETYHYTVKIVDYTIELFNWVKDKIRR